MGYDAANNIKCNVWHNLWYMGPNTQDYMPQCRMLIFDLLYKLVYLVYMFFHHPRICTSYQGSYSMRNILYYIYILNYTHIFLKIFNTLSIKCLFRSLSIQQQKNASNNKKKHPYNLLWLRSSLCELTFV